MSTHEIDLEEEFARTRLSRAVLGRIWKFSQPYRRQVMIALALEGPWVATMLAMPFLVEIAFDDVIPQGDFFGLCIIALLMLFAIVLRSSIAMYQVTTLVSSGQEILTDLRRELFAHIQRLSMRYFDRTRHGRIIARVDRDIETLEHPIVWGPITIASSALMLTGVLGFMAYYDLPLAAGVTLIVPALLFVTHFFKERGLAAYREVRESTTKITAHYAETIGGVRVIQAFVGEDRNRGRFADLLEEHNGQIIKAAVIWNGYVPAMGLVYAIATILILAAGGQRVMNGDMTAGELAAFLLLIGMFFRPIEALGDLYNQSLSAASAAERIFLLLDTQSEVVNRPQAIAAPRLDGRVAFEHVSFTYERRRALEEANRSWAIRDLNLEIPAGSTAAFVGRTGAGKSSIINLVARFYDVTGGRITLDGADLRDYTLESLHSQMGIVLQETFLFHGTVMQNIKFARPTATDQEAIAAAHALGCDEVFLRLRNGYQTEVGDRGASLSEGERQLVSFTRAMLADPRILILDEATSSVDVLTEMRIQDALSNLAANRTTLIIAHRLATIRRADCIFVVDDGAIIESGRHDDLVARKGRYFEMIFESRGRQRQHI